MSGVSLDRRTGATVGLGAWAVVCSLGCGLFFRPDPPPAVDAEGCDDDHGSMWAPDPLGAEVTFDEVPADGTCNEGSWFSGGGAQGGDTFHFEPQLHVTNPDLVVPEFPTIQWEIRRDGGVEGSGWVEIYEEDITRRGSEIYITPRALIQADDRGKNFEIEMRMEVSRSTGESETETVELVARAGVYII